MCHKSISELSPELSKKAREIESLVSARLSIVSQAEIIRETGVDKSKISKLIKEDLDLIASMLTICGLKVVPEDYLFTSPEIAEATRQMLANCFTSPEFMRILFK